MGTPADFARTATLTQVTSVRTCGDHGYIATAGQLWAWFCVTNAIARSLGLAPFKDVFRTDPDVAGDEGEPEALLSVLSTGPVGLGDRVGRTDVDLALRTCRADGVLIKPDVPIAATGASMLANAAFVPALVVAECWTDHAAGRWTYVMAFDPHPGDDTVEGEIRLADLGEASPTTDRVVLWDARAATATVVPADHAVPVSLGREEWTYLVLAPVLDGDLAVIGDVSKLVPAGDARIEVSPVDGGVEVLAKGAGETVTVTGWAATAPTADGHPVDHDPSTGLWTVPVDVPSRGWATVTLHP